jgi:hypothetical protein
MRAWLAASLLLLLSGQVAAHQLKAAMTTVLINERTGNLELMHRFYLHDTEHAVESLLGGHADLFKSAKDRENFAKYVNRKVALQLADKTPLKLSLIGQEIDGKFFWVYQETKIPAKFSALRMQQGALRDVWSEQVNMVNFEGKGKVKTLHFDGDDDWLTVHFDN